MRALVDETIDDVFTTSYYAATDCIKKTTFLIVEDVITEMFHHGVLDTTTNKTSERFSRLHASMEPLIDRLVSNLGFASNFTAFLKQRSTDGMKEKLFPES